MECTRPSRQVYGATASIAVAINVDDTYVTGVPHSVISRDNYRGYDVPEGAMIIPNIWYDAFSPRRRTFRLVLTLWTSNQVDDSGP